MSRFRRTRPRIFVIPSLLLLLVSGGIVGCESDDASEPNLILITADRLPADHLGCFGGVGHAGKSVCRLGEGGTLYGWTLTGTSGAASSAASVLTGLPAAGHGVDDSGLSFLSDIHVTLAERLSAAGYATAAFVDHPTLNRSRRLDQGFDHYDDRITADRDLAARVQRWIASAREPHFAWIQLGHDTPLAEIDRLVARLDAILGQRSAGTGVLFTSLRGAKLAEGGIRRATHRVPMIWRAPNVSSSASRPQVSFALASLQDVVPTLLASAGIGPLPSEEPETNGIELDRLGAAEGDRFLLLEDENVGSEIGLASDRALYVRKRSVFEESGQPVPTTSLALFAPRFLTLPIDAVSDARSARLPQISWREDVLSADSPVPRLEFHLARRIRGEPASAAE